MASSKKKTCLFISLLLLLLVSAVVHGARPADARDAAAAAAAGDGARVTVRTGRGHGHSGGHSSGGVSEHGGAAGVVDPRNLNARSHHHSGAASSRAALWCSSPAACVLAGAILAVPVVVLP